MLTLCVWVLVAVVLIMLALWCRWVLSLERCRRLVCRVVLWLVNLCLSSLCLVCNRGVELTSCPTLMQLMCMFRVVVGVIRLVSVRRMNVMKSMCWSCAFACSVSLLTVVVTLDVCLVCWLLESSVEAESDCSGVAVASVV